MLKSVYELFSVFQIEYVLLQQDTTEMMMRQVIDFNIRSGWFLVFRANFWRKGFIFEFGPCVGFYSYNQTFIIFDQVVLVGPVELWKTSLSV